MLGKSTKELANTTDRPIVIIQPKSITGLISETTSEVKA